MRGRNADRPGWEDAPVRGLGFGSAPSVNPALWIAAVGVAASVFMMYVREAQQSRSGRGSGLFAPHLVPTPALLAIACVVVACVLVSLWLTRSVAAAVRLPGLVLAAAGGVAAVAASPADAVWRIRFTPDSVQWSPAHLLSVVGVSVLGVAVLVMTRHLGRPAGRIGLAVALLGVTQVVLLEYDMNVPQFAEVLYLPALVAVGLGAAWLIHHGVATRYAVTWTVAAYLVFRVAVFAVLAVDGWPRPDVPLALLGLVAVDLARRWGRMRWPLAGLALAGLQVLASATGVSSVRLAPTAASAVGVGSVLAVTVIALVVRQRALPALVAVAMMIGIPLIATTPARAHNPGSGSDIGSARVAVSGNGSGVLAVTVADLQGVPDDAVRPDALVARRAGRKVTGTVRSAPSSTGRAYVGSITLPSSGLWFVYVELRESARPLETWRAVDYSVAAPTAERRTIYVPSAAESRSATEYVAGFLLYGVSVVLLVWAVVFLRRSAADRAEGAATVA